MRTQQLIFHFNASRTGTTADNESPAIAWRPISYGAVECESAKTQYTHV